MVITSCVAVTPVVKGGFALSDPTPDYSLFRACKINCVTGYHASSSEEGGFDDQARPENGCVVG
jgi:hypothetical protein